MNKVHKLEHYIMCVYTSVYHMEVVFVRDAVKQMTGLESEYREPEGVHLHVCSRAHVQLYVCVWFNDSWLKVFSRFAPKTYRFC